MRISPKKLLTIHNGIGIRNRSETTLETKNRLGLSEDTLVFGMVAVLVPRKGHLVLLEAVSKLSQEGKLIGKNIVILIEGEGPLHQELMAYVRTHYCIEIFNMGLEG